uniref:Uncharacterized protein n=1 Tax=Cannabis sativa TaxID=3483 RepID=A0A803NK81_CANSA
MQYGGDVFLISEALWRDCRCGLHSFLGLIHRDLCHPFGCIHSEKGFFVPLDVSVVEEVFLLPSAISTSEEVFFSSANNVLYHSHGALWLPRRRTIPATVENLTNRW